MLLFVLDLTILFWLSITVILRHKPGSIPDANKIVRNPFSDNLSTNKQIYSPKLTDKAHSPGSVLPGYWDSHPSHSPVSDILPEAKYNQYFRLQPSHILSFPV